MTGLLHEYFMQQPQFWLLIIVMKSLRLEFEGERNDNYVIFCFLIRTENELDILYSTYVVYKALYQYLNKCYTG